jgi:hypothetical protein
MGRCEQRAQDGGEKDPSSHRFHDRTTGGKNPEAGHEGHKG